MACWILIEKGEQTAPTYSAKSSSNAIRCYPFHDPRRPPHRRLRESLSREEARSVTAEILSGKCTDAPTATAFVVEGRRAHCQAWPSAVSAPSSALIPTTKASCGLMRIILYVQYNMYKMFHEEH